MSTKIDFGSNLKTCASDIYSCMNCRYIGFEVGHIEESEDIEDGENTCPNCGSEEGPFGLIENDPNYYGEINIVFSSDTTITEWLNKKNIVHKDIMVSLEDLPYLLLMKEFEERLKKGKHVSRFESGLPEKK